MCIYHIDHVLKLYVIRGIKMRLFGLVRNAKVLKMIKKIVEFACIVKDVILPFTEAFINDKGHQTNPLREVRCKKLGFEPVARTKHAKPWAVKKEKADNRKEKYNWKRFEIVIWL